MKSILVVNVNWIGDVIFSSPVFKALKESYPTAHISCLAVPRVKEILESIPFIDEIIVYDEDGYHRNPLAKLKLILKLRRERFDAAFLLHRSLTRALLVYLAGIPHRVGYDEKGRGRFLTHIVEPLEVQVHRSDHYLNIIESYGVSVNDRRYQLNVQPDAVNAIEEILKSRTIPKDEYLVIINPGGNWDLKCWPPENFARLICGLVSDFNAKFVISGAQKDNSLAKKINSFAINKAINLTGQTTLKQLAALMKKADVVISGDSGPLHIANGVGTEIIGLFGPTRPEITGPRGSGRAHIIQNDVGCNREACYHLRCPDNICMKSITVRSVRDIVEQIKNQ